MKKTILITGVNGMLGRSILRQMKNSQTEIYGLGRSENPLDRGLTEYIQGDLTNPNFYDQLKSKINPDWVIHCAALVNLKTCELDTNKAEAIHVQATRDLVSVFSHSGFIYISTDSVFDGVNGDYTELDQPNPLNHYARTKNLGEQEVINHSGKPYVLRTNIYSNSSPSRGSLFEWAYRELSQGNELTGFTNFVFNPLHVDQVARVVKKICEDKVSTGVYHLGVDESISKFQFLEKIADEFGFDKTLIKSAVADPNSGGIHRPLNTSLNADKIKEILGISLKLDEGFENLKESLFISNLNG